MIVTKAIHEGLEVIAVFTDDGLFVSLESKLDSEKEFTESEDYESLPLNVKKIVSVLQKEVLLKKGLLNKEVVVDLATSTYSADQIIELLKFDKIPFFYAKDRNGQVFTLYFQENNGLDMAIKNGILPSHLKDVES